MAFAHILSAQEAVPGRSNIFFDALATSLATLAPGTAACGRVLILLCGHRSIQVSDVPGVYIECVISGMQDCVGPVVDKETALSRTCKVCPFGGACTGETSVQPMFNCMYRTPVTV